MDVIDVCVCSCLIIMRQTIEGFYQVSCSFQYNLLRNREQTEDGGIRLCSVNTCNVKPFDFSFFFLVIKSLKKDI